MACLAPSRRRITAASTLLALFLWSHPCISATTTAQSPPAQAAVPDTNATRTPIRRADAVVDDLPDRLTAPSLTSSIAVLGLMLGGVYVVLNWLRRRQDADPLCAGAIDLLASRRLDAHATLHLVRIGQRVLAVGTSPAGARTLAAIDDPEEIALLISASAAGASPGTGLLGRTTFGRRAPRSAGKDDEPSRTPTHTAAGQSETPA